MKRTQRTGQSNDQYGRFVRDLRLFNVALVRCASQIDHSAYFELHKREGNASRNLSAQYGLARVAADFFDAYADFKLEITGKKKKQKVLLIKCRYEAHIHLSRKFDRSCAERFANTEFRVVLWPYFREFVNDLSARMWIPPITIPLSVAAHSN